MADGNRVCAVILAGGRGSRLGSETRARPKALVEIGSKPLLWHVMKIYSEHGIRDLIVCLGHQGRAIREYFLGYGVRDGDVTIDLARGTVRRAAHPEPWRITLVDTGEETMTGGRLRRIRPHLGADPLFCMSYCDGLADVDVGASLAFHRAHGRLATVTAVHPPARFGALTLAGERVVDFAEKRRSDAGYVSGGFFVLSPAALDQIDGDATAWEREPLERLAAAGELMAFRHEGFWHPVDTPQEREHLQELWNEGKAPWKTW